MLYTGITPVHEFNGIYIKREDLACWESLEYPSGSKVRQYMAMAEPYKPHNQLGAFEQGFSPKPIPPCIVGCSANSAQQIYVASTAKRLNTKGIIYTAKRRVKSEATQYAINLGAEINEVGPPGYLSGIRKAARQRIVDLNRQVVQWDRDLAIKDASAQCINIPEGIKRIIVPTGSGLTVAGVLIGTKALQIIAICTSPMADKAKIMKLVHSTGKYLGSFPDTRLTVIPPQTPYDVPQIARLPDDTPLDPFYAAKAYTYLQDGDLLWVPGLRPVISMPIKCQETFKNWKGPKL